MSRPSYSVSVGVMLLAGDGLNERILFGLREGVDQGAGVWACPGGRMELDDHGIVAAGARELHEETGLTLDTDSAQVLRTALKEGVHVPTGRHFMCVFVLGLWSPELDPHVPTDLDGLPHVDVAETGPLGKSHAAWRWMSAADLMTLPEGQVWDRELALSLLPVIGRSPADARRLEIHPGYTDLVDPENQRLAGLHTI